MYAMSIVFLKAKRTAAVNTRLLDELFWRLNRNDLLDNNEKQKGPSLESKQPLRKKKTN